MISGRALHYVFKIGDRGANSHFFRNVLGMQVLRHEEFDEGGCDAKCNGPYDNRWSKTMIGYGSEHTHYIMELTYNYGIKSYELGNEFAGTTIRSRETIDRAKSLNYPIKKEDNGLYLLISPDGYKFYIIDEPQPTDKDPIVRTILNVSNLEKSINYWHETLQMKLLSKNEKSVVLFYDKFIELELVEIDEPLNRAESFGRIVFAVPFALQPKINDVINNGGHTVLHKLLVLDTPGKASVRVLILADPDGHEICFVDEEGFSQLSEPDPTSESSFDKDIHDDPFQQK